MARHGEHSEPHGSTGLYVGVFVALCVLTLCSFFTYSEWWRTHVPIRAGWAFMLAVAVCKALLVTLYFMHLRWEAAWKYVLTLPTLGMALFLMAALIPDIGMRQENYDAERKSAAAAPAPGTGHEAAGHGPTDVGPVKPAAPAH